MFYRIVIHGDGSQVQTVFSDLDLEHDGELCVLTGPVLDQSQLQGILAMILGLDLPLVSFEPVDSVSLQ